MSTVTEIARAIEQLPAEDFAALRRWFMDRESQLWEEQIDANSAAGRLDFLFEEAAAERAKGELRDW